MFLSSLKKIKIYTSDENKTINSTGDKRTLENYIDFGTKGNVPKNKIKTIFSPRDVLYIYIIVPSIVIFSSLIIPAIYYCFNYTHDFYFPYQVFGNYTRLLCFNWQLFRNYFIIVIIVLIFKLIKENLQKRKQANDL